MTQKLFETNAAIKAEADELLDNRGLRKLIEEYAPFHIVGSYTLELMVWRDLDVAMDAPDITISQFFELGERITESLSPWKMFFTDNRNNDPGSHPRGLYWGIRLGDSRKGAWNPHSAPHLRGFRVFILIQITLLFSTIKLYILLVSPSAL